MPERIEELQATLDSVGRNLTLLASQNRINPIYERKEIIEQLSTLLSNHENNVLLVGEPGTGKNAIVEGLACWIAKKYVQPYFQNIIECTHDSFQAFCLYAHEFETKIKIIISELQKNNAILFFDQINSIITAGAAAGALDRTLANLLNPYLARNEITIIGATTNDGYKSMEKSNPSFTRRFIRLEIPEIPPKGTLKILKELKQMFFSKYEKIFQEGVFELIIDLSDRFYRNRFFPGKAFEIIQEVTSLKNGKKTEFRDSLEVTRNDVYTSFQRRTGLADFIIVRDKPLTKKSVHSYFKEKVIGQDEAIEAVTRIILRLKSEMNDPHKPIAALFFAGPTGVGKTYISRLLAKYLLGSEKKLLRYDMAEYSTSESAHKLIGGHFDNTRPKLIEDVYSNPFSIILFDEIEKAHPSIFNLLLSVLGEGRLTDNTGLTVDFCNTIMIMTSNIGAELYGKKQIGLVHSDATTDIGNDVIAKISEYFSPEFINRLTKVIAFKPLTEDQVRIIAKNEIEKLKARKGMLLKKLKINISEALIEFITKKGYSAKYGARPMQRVVDDLIGDTIAESICAGTIKHNSEILLDIGKGDSVIIQEIK